MNIWDSVQRGLEKATHEAGRIARIQRLRSTIDNLSRQTTIQQSTLLAKAMEVFAAGKLTQSEFLPICQELASLQQQLEQAQAELKFIQSQGTPVTTTTQPPTTTTNGPDLAATVYAPPPPGYQPQQAFDVTVPAPTPPPPTEAYSLKELEALATGSGSGATAIDGQCLYCGASRITGNMYCANCGHPFEGVQVDHLPTVRGNSFVAEQATKLEGNSASGVSEQPTVYTPDTPPIEKQETMRGEAPSAPEERSHPSEQDGGH